MSGPGVPSGHTSAENWRDMKRAAIDEVFASAERQDSSMFESPSGRYSIEVVSWVPKSGWKYSEGIIRSQRRDPQDPLAVVRRNYGQFPFTWCETHPNGHDYLVCGEDYQGQTIIELDTGQRTDDLQDQAEQGFGFCWAQHYVAPKGDILIVDGCYWACPYELVAFDFSQPLELPYRELHRWIGDLAIVDGFNSDGTLTWTFDREVRLSDGKPYAELSEAEEAALLDAEGKYLPGLLGTQNYRASWEAGQPFESTTVELIASD